MKDKHVLLRQHGFTRQDGRRPFAHAAGLRAAGRWQPRLRRRLSAGALQRPRRSSIQPDADADGSRQRRSDVRHQPERRRRRHKRADGGAPVHAPVVDDPGQSHVRVRPQPAQRSAGSLPGRRSRHALGSADALDDLHPRRIGAVHDRRVAILRSSAASSRSPTPCRGRAAVTICASAAASRATRAAAPAASRARRCSGPSRSSTRRPRRSSS